MKLWATIMAFMLLAALLPAETKVTITSPVSGEDWMLGSTQRFTWNSNGYTGTVMIEVGRIDGGTEYCSLPPGGHPYPPAANEFYQWKVGDTGPGNPPLPPGEYSFSIYHMGGDIDGSWSLGGRFTITSVISQIPKYKILRIMYRLPFPPDPCLCPEFDLKPLGEVFAELKSPVRIVLMKNGRQIQELGNFAKGSRLPASLKPMLSQKDFDQLKGGKAKFTLAVLGAHGKILSEHALENQLIQLKR